MLTTNWYPYVAVGKGVWILRTPSRYAAHKSARISEVLYYYIVLVNNCWISTRVASITRPR